LPVAVKNLATRGLNGYVADTIVVGISEVVRARDYLKRPQTEEDHTEKRDRQNAYYGYATR
jgi:GTP cyclohydrolase I